jgi:hypothetical protein
MYAETTPSILLLRPNNSVQRFHTASVRLGSDSQSASCLLSPWKRTHLRAQVTSAWCQLRTSDKGPRLQPLAPQRSIAFLAFVPKRQRLGLAESTPPSENGCSSDLGAGGNEERCNVARCKIVQPAEYDRGESEDGLVDGDYQRDHRTHIG